MIMNPDPEAGKITDLRLLPVPPLEAVLPQTEVVLQITKVAVHQLTSRIHPLLVKQAHPIPIIIQQAPQKKRDTKQF